MTPTLKHFTYSIDAYISKIKIIITASFALLVHVPIKVTFQFSCSLSANVN